MMSIVASLPSVVKPRFIEPVGESQTSEGDACYLRDTPDNGARNIAGASSPGSQGSQSRDSESDRSSSDGIES
jgi:hypothetical protein